MITSGTFGAGGRLGNQLFQVGLLFAVAARNGCRFGVARRGEQIWECFDLDVPEPAGEPTHHFAEIGSTICFDPRVFDQPDGTAFHGYFQSYRYYEACESELRSFLRFQSRHFSQAAAEIERLRREYPLRLVGVHYRRTDYVEAWCVDSWGNLHADGYYDRVFDTLGDDVLYLVFSDDLGWCRENVRRPHIEFIDRDAYVSLCMMTLCDINVTANSSFSWWGAFLNRCGSKVLAPERWFALPEPAERPAVVVLPDWTKIPVLQRAAGELNRAP